MDIGSDFARRGIGVDFRKQIRHVLLAVMAVTERPDEEGCLVQNREFASRLIVEKNFVASELLLEVFPLLESLAHGLPVSRRIGRT